MKRWQPDLCCPSIFEVPWGQLRREGFTHVVFDLDNTLGAWRTPQLPDDGLGLLAILKEQGFIVGVLSNSALRGRKTQIADPLDALGVPLVCSAHKPFLTGYHTLLRQLDALPAKTIMVGDQWWTDIIGAKRLGMFAVLVNPMDYFSEPWWVRWRRWFEKWMLRG